MPQVRFLPDNLVIEVPAGTTLLQAAKKAGARMGDACGGNCACSTCHVYVRQGFDTLSEQEDKELDILDKAFGVIATSRLGCQSKLVVGDANVTVEITPESHQAWLNEHPGERSHGS